MTQRLGFWNWNPQRADRLAINENADELDLVSSQVDMLKAQLRMQAEEMLWLRATLMGVVEVLHAKAPFDDAELKLAVEEAHRILTAPPAPPPSATGPNAGNPYRDGTSAAPSGPPVALRTCIRCKRQVPASRITVFPDGEVCDSCL
jgi:hypothetical protein